MQKTGMLIVLSGPSGAGKGTICARLLERNPQLKLSISCTTRLPRPNETEGVDYFFKSDAEFMKMAEEGEFLEYARVFDYLYGTPRQYVKDQIKKGHDVILEIDVQGALKVKDKMDKGVFIFIVPPSMEELKRRLKKRNSEMEEQALKRFATAYLELDFIEKYNYIVVNDEVEKAVKKVECIITAERCRMERNRGMDEILKGGKSL
ncbi:MAG: guanylate kinase [Bacillota bacterium]|nr:guanylate kinase [Bacillota bacterium]